MGPRKIAWPCGNHAQPSSWASGMGLASLPLALSLAAPASAHGPGPIWLAAFFSLYVIKALFVFRHPATTPAGSCWMETQAEGSLPGSMCSELDIQPLGIAVPQGGSPRAGHRGAATVLSTRSPNDLSPTLWRKRQEMVYSSEGHLWS